MIPVGTNLELNKPPNAVLTIIALNVVVFIGEAFLAPETRVWALHRYGFGPGSLSPVALVTSLFLHADIFHIVFNMLFLWIFGGPVENRIGTKTFLVYYFGAGLSSAALQTIMELLARPGTQMVAIGASGAISGMIAIYLYRCFYSKVKMVVDPIFLPVRVHIPAAPLILFWFFQDVVGGIAGMSHFSHIGHWAHVGGFLFGLAIARIKKYGHEGQVEHYKEKVLSKLKEGGGWEAVEKELKKLLQITPKDPDLHQELARYYVSQKDFKKAEEHYQYAVQKFFLTNPVHAAFTLLERQDSLPKPMGDHYSLRAAEALVQAGYIEDAYRALFPITGSKSEKGALTERAYALFIKVCRDLYKDDEANEAFALFTANYPKSKYHADVKKALSLKPGEVFPKKEVSLGEQKTREDAITKDDEQEQPGFVLLAQAVQTVTDPRFLLLWTVLYTMYFAFIGDRYTWRGPISIFLIAYVLVTAYKIEWFELLSWLNRPDEKRMRLEAEISTSYDRAILAQKGENFPKAAELYQKVLQLDPGNVHARFNLARMYQNNMRDPANARKHFRMLKDHLAKDHPFYGEAEEALKKKTI
jgi:membrane associated rhomboid family serine protease